jgi:very-short-patch-repair endonuclease
MTRSAPIPLRVRWRTHTGVTTDVTAMLDRYHHLTVERFLESGRSRSTWDRLHEPGPLVRVHPGVSRLAAIEPTPAHAMHAALLASGPGSGSLMSHLSAAWLWGADVCGDAPVDLTVLDRRRGLRLDGVRLHRPRNLDGLRPALRQRLVTTSPMRTVLDVGAVAPPDVVASVVETFVVRRYVRIAALRQAMAVHARPGRRGVGVLRIVLDDWRLGDQPPDSVLEIAMGRLLRDHALPVPVFHHRVRTALRTYELDFAFVPEHIAIEVDGWAYHGSRRAFESDRERDAELAAAGWLVLRFTWYQVRRRPAWVAARISDAIGRRS